MFEALSLFSIALVAAAIGAYFGAYLREKGKGRAIQEDLHRLVQATEAIKAQVSGELWLGQTRWQLKRELYATLLEALSDARVHIILARQELELPSRAEQ